MTRVHYTDRHRETCFLVWYGCGLNFSRAITQLNTEHGFSMARSTLKKWCDKYEWHKRATALDQAERDRRDAELSGRARILRDLMRRKDYYDRYFGQEETRAEDELLKRPDHQAVHAYTNLCRAILSVQGRELEALEEEAVPQGAPGLSSKAVRHLRDRLAEGEG